MSLDSISPTRKREPDVIFLIGVEGIGKSTFSAEAPNPIFIASEAGLAEIDAKAFPEPQNFDDVLGAVDVLINSDHDYKTLSIDTVDWIEPLVWKKVCASAGADNIEEVGGGYQKGYIAALDPWRLLLGRLEQLRRKRGMEIHLIAHTGVNTFNNPAGPDYSRFEPAIQKKAAALLKQWAKTVLFATYEEYAVDAKQGTVPGVATNKKVKGYATGARVMHTQRTAAWDAKNRYSLPPTLPFRYSEYAAAREAGLQTDPGELVRECLELADRLSLPADATPRLFVEKNKTNPAELLRALNKLRTTAGEAGL